MQYSRASSDRIPHRLTQASSNDDGGENHDCPRYARDDHFTLAPHLIESIAAQLLEGSAAKPLAARELGCGKRALQEFIDFAFLSSSTVSQVLACFTRQLRFVDERGILVAYEKDDGLVLSVCIPKHPRESRYTKHALAFVLALLRTFTGQHLTPLRARFAHPRPTDLKPYQSLFDIDEFSFDRRDSALTFDRNVLALHQRTDAIERPWAERGSSPPPSASERDDERHRVTRAIAESLRNGRGFSLEHVAGLLEMTTRTLQRRLNEQGMTFRSVVEDVRKELVAEHLNGSRLSIKEIAFLLGYAEPRAFHRAFLRWHGVTPAEARRRAKSTTVTLQPQARSI